MRRNIYLPVGELDINLMISSDNQKFRCKQSNRMKKGLKVFLTAAIVLSAVACSTANDKETKTKETKEKIVETKEDTSVPKEYRNALRSAKTYSDMMHMSKQGIYDQLTSEYGDQFDVEAAQYAIDNLNADYNENALKCGENYKKTMHMSKARIYDQLTSKNGENFRRSTICD